LAKSLTKKEEGKGKESNRATKIYHFGVKKKPDGHTRVCLFERTMIVEVGKEKRIDETSEERKIRRDL
jgi:hypothetical protein